jgi:hypothetical protein
MDKYTDTNTDVAGFETLTKFDSFFVNRYSDAFVTGYSFVFITKPLLFLYPIKPQGNTASDRLLKLAYENMTLDQNISQYLTAESMNINDRTILEQLSFFEGNFASPYNRNNFLPIFTNKIKGFSTTDVVMEQQEAFASKQGFRMPLPTNKIQSEAANTLSIPLFETQNLDIMKTLNIWVNYISNITDGTFHANPFMVKNGVIDYMSSIYYFVLEPDGRTLKYWAKYTGCWPNTIPYSQLSFNRGQSTMVEVDASFVYTSKEDMNVAILEDFNRISLNVKSIAREPSTDEYLSLRKSLWLTKENIISLPNYSPDIRGPLVFYKGQQPNIPVSLQQSNNFELTFGDETYKSTFVKDKFGDEYFFNTKEFFKSKLDEE